MSGGKVLALFDVDGTLTKPRNVSARPQAWDILMSRCQSVPLSVCARARLCVSLCVNLICLWLGQQEVTAEMKAFMAQLRGKVSLSLSLSLALALARARRRACSLYPTL